MASLPKVILAICVFSNLRLCLAQDIINDSKQLLESLMFLSKQTQPLLADVCKQYNATSKVNFAKANQTDIENNAIFRALLLLRQADCSNLITSFACAIFAPEVRARFGAAIPPCRSVCKTITKSCAAFLQIAVKFFPFPKGPCKLSEEGRLFRGKVSKTKSGVECQEWSSQFPHKHWITPKTHPNEDLSENYCRNPDGESGGPWCYTKSKSKRWDYCDVQLCMTSLRCHWLPNDGCVDFKYDKITKNVKATIKGIPKKSDFSKFLNSTSFESITKWLEFLK